MMQNKAPEITGKYLRKGRKSIPIELRTTTVAIKIIIPHTESEKVSQTVQTVKAIPQAVQIRKANTNRIVILHRLFATASFCERRFDK
jgi:hypothetical protein